MNVAGLTLDQIIEALAGEQRDHLAALEARVAALTAHIETLVPTVLYEQRLKEESQARVAALTAALEQIREQRCCDHCPEIAEAALYAAGGLNV